jgi:hypothetical protein
MLNRVPDHSRIQGNEDVDILAREGQSIHFWSQASNPISSCVYRLNIKE